MSVQAVIAAANAIFAGLEQVKAEIVTAKKLRTSEDSFVQVMEPFSKQTHTIVTALRNDATALDDDLKSVLVYYGEAVDSADGMKPEELFVMIMSFSSALRVRIPPPVD